MASEDKAAREKRVAALSALHGSDIHRIARARLLEMVVRLELMVNQVIHYYFSVEDQIVIIMQDHITSRLPLDVRLKIMATISADSRIWQIEVEHEHWRDAEERPQLIDEIRSLILLRNQIAHAALAIDGDQGIHEFSPSPKARTTPTLFELHDAVKLAKSVEHYLQCVALRCDLLRRG